MISIKIAIVVTVLFAVGCSSSEPPVLTGRFMESVSGLTYTTDTQSGVTNSEGEFLYRRGEIVKFSIGSLNFPSLTGKQVVTPLTMSESRELNDNVVINISTLLQSLDEDGELDNGIQIPLQAATAATSVDFSVSPEVFAQDQNVINLVANSGSVNSTLLNAQDTSAHFQNVLFTADYRWVNLPAAVDTGLFENACDAERFRIAAGIITSGAYDTDMLRPGYRPGIDAVDQITGAGTGSNELEAAISTTENDFICLLVNEQGRQEIVQLLDYYASRDLLQRHNDTDIQMSPMMFYGVTRAMYMWAALEPYTDLPAEQSLRIENWLGRRMDEIAPVEPTHTQDCSGGGLYSENCGNWGVVSAHAIMLNGAVTGNVDNFNYGVSQFRNFLSAFRADGSYPEDARRGCRALSYSLNTIAGMAGIAEIGLQRGINLYKEEVNGLSLSDGAKYLIAVKDDNSIIVQYANVDNRMDPSHRDGCPGGPNGRQVQQNWEDFYPLWQWALRHSDDEVARRVVENLPSWTRGAMFPDTGSISYLWTLYPG